MILKIVYWLASITQVPNAKGKFSKSFSGQNIITTLNRGHFTHCNTAVSITRCYLANEWMAILLSSTFSKNCLKKVQCKSFVFESRGDRKFNLSCDWDIVTSSAPGIFELDSVVDTTKWNCDFMLLNFVLPAKDGFFIFSNRNIEKWYTRSESINLCGGVQTTTGWIIKRKPLTVTLGNSTQNND